MNIENQLWGCHRIADELKKLGIDFMTIGTLFGKKFYLLIIQELKTRRLIHYDLTEKPSR
ncbi:hypothetical protein DV872_13000 [Oceanispirochaeta sp. M1]|nr:hypothetical protein DV872_13000 [Oceanispirochaeta sp. M1]